MVYLLVALQILYFSQRILCLCNNTNGTHDYVSRIRNFRFPNEFLFGAATAAYQVEGAWNVDGKGPSIWDEYTHEYPDRIEDHSTGDDACKSYYLYKEDVKALKTMGMNFYRFSISWPRIMPTGYRNNINMKGIQYYNNLINELIDNKITPLVTMYHWDLPHYLQKEFGGWTNEAIIPLFVDYADVLFSYFGDRVKLWVTFNEPQFSALGYDSTSMAPGIFSNGTGQYLAAHNIIRSHARVYHLYNNTYRARQNGKVSLTPNIFSGIPLNKTSRDDWEAAFQFMLFYVGWFTDPIYRGDYPRVMKERIANISKKQGFPHSRLPAFTDEEIKYINGTADFFPFNAYAAIIINRSQDAIVSLPSYYGDMGLNMFSGPKWLMSNTSSWEAVAPIALRSIMNWIVGRYGEQWTLFITENGFADDGRLNDTERITYLATYMTEILKAIYIDKIKLTALTVWALIDNFEWTSGYTSKWGLYQVNFNDPNRTRTPKQSSHFMKEVIIRRTVPKHFTPIDLKIDIITLWPGQNVIPYVLLQN